MKQTRIVNSADTQSPTAPLIADEPLRNEIVALLAEILVLDFQEHTHITVSSPPQTNRRLLPNALSGLLQSAQQPIRRTDVTVNRNPDTDKEAP